MIPDKHPHEDFVVFGIRWTPGARKTVLWVVFAACGGLWLGWERIAQLLPGLHVWAFIAFLTYTCLSPIPALAVNSVHSPEAASHFMCVTSHYGRTERIFNDQ